MYLYFNNQGVLKEIVNDDAIRQGNSNINKIRFFIEGAEPQIVNNVYKAITFITGVRTFIDVNGNQLTTESISLSTEELQIPYDKKRELKFFQYFTKYEMFSITVPDDILNESGTVGCRVQMVSAEGIITLGLIVFNVEITTGGQAIIEPDTAINIAQWNYLISNMLTPEKYVVKYNADATQWDIVPTEGSTKPVTSGGIAIAIANALSAVYKPMGNATINELNTMEKSEAMNGYVYNLNDSGVLTDFEGQTISVNEGDNVVFIWDEGDWYWDKLSGIFDTSNLVTTNTAQTITGAKTFTVDTNLGDSSQSESPKLGFISADATNQGNWYAYVSQNQQIFNIHQLNSGQFIGFRFTRSNLTPTHNNYISLGASSYRYKDLYLSGIFHLGTWEISEDSYNRIYLKIGGQTNYYIGSTSCYLPHLYPNANNVRDLGQSSYYWKDLYLSGAIKYTDNLRLEKDSYDRIAFYDKDNTLRFVFGSSVQCRANFAPYSNNSYDLGGSSSAWKDLHIAGAIKGAATMTQAQYDALVSGGTVEADTFYFIEEE